MAIGEFFWAYADADEEFDPDVHNVWDEDIFAFQYQHGEGDFASVTFTIRNPRVGLLNTGRKRWAWFSVETASGLLPLFYGRLNAVPSNMFREKVDVIYTARPADFVVQKEALAEAMRVAPYWDPMLVTPDRLADPDVVLEAYSKLWHIDPVTHVVTASDILTGEDGTITVAENEIIDASLDMQLREAPRKKCIVTCTVPWDNYAVGGPIDVVPAFMGTFGQLLTSYTLKGLQSSWPKEGATVQGGYTIALGSELQDVSYTAVRQLKVPEYFEWYGSFPPSALPEGSIAFLPNERSKTYSGVDGASFESQSEMVYAPLGYGVPILKVNWGVSRDYTETITVELATSTQDVVTDASADEPIIITLSTNKASDVVDGAVPIGDVRRRHFAKQQRGLQLAKHLLCLARAALVNKSRAVEIKFEMPFLAALAKGFTLRKSVHISNPRLPGGEATGKIVNIAMGLDGNTGRATLILTMACAVGYGDSVAPSAGAPTYGSTDYMGADYQVFTDVLVAVDPSLNDIVFSVDPYSPADDGIDIARLESWRDIIVTAGIDNPADIQLGYLEPLFTQIGDVAEINSRLQEVPTTVFLEFRNLNNGPFITPVTVTASLLVLPKQIDLEAA